MALTQAASTEQHSQPIARTPRVLYFADVTPEIASLVRAAVPADWQFVAISPDAGKERIVDAFAQAECVLCANAAVTAEYIQVADRLSMVQKFGIGYDNVDVAALAQRGIPLAVCPTASTDAVAEHAVMLMLAVAKRLVNMSADVDRGGWPRWAYRREITNISGATVGLLGFGRIGQAVAERVLAFGATVKAYRRPSLLPDAGWLHRVQLVDGLDELFTGTDIVSIHAPLTEETRRLVDRHRLSQLNDDAIVVNTARGEIVVEDDLAAALRSGRLRGAGLDTLAIEPPDGNSPLVGLANVVITPHLAGGGTAVLRAKAAAVVENINRHFQGEAIQWRVV